MLTSGKIILGEVRKTFTLRGLGQECEEGEKFSKGWGKLVSIKTQVSLWAMGNNEGVHLEGKRGHWTPDCGHSVGWEREQGRTGPRAQGQLGGAWGCYRGWLLAQIRSKLDLYLGNMKVKYNLLHLFTWWNSCGCSIYNLSIYRCTETHFWLTTLQIAKKNVNVMNSTHLTSFYLYRVLGLFSHGKVSKDRTKEILNMATLIYLFT